jgi:cytochrome c-type biogenesis protein
MTSLMIGTAFWLGLLTAISPCPLATNISAISFIGRQVRSRRHVLFSGLFYTIGRTLTYVLLGILITAGLTAVGDLSRFLQKYLNEILGPVLILLGMVLLGWIGGSLSMNLAGTKVQEKASKGGLGWAAMLGFLFALSFCPVSAGLFFGGLIPLAVKANSSFLLPLIYGVGTALPVIGFAFIIAFATEYVGKAFDSLTIIEKWIRIIAGVLFIIVGIYYSITHVYGVS